jgi:hypothetical protein
LTGTVEKEFKSTNTVITIYQRHQIHRPKHAGRGGYKCWKEGSEPLNDQGIIAWEKKEQEIGGGHLWEDINSPPISDKAFIENCMIGVYVPSFMMSDGSIKKKLD